MQVIVPFISDILVDTGDLAFLLLVVLRLEQLLSVLAGLLHAAGQYFLLLHQFLFHCSEKLRILEDGFVLIR